MNRYIHTNLKEEKNLFLSSGRSSRISNIKDVEDYFKKKEFEVIDPSNLPIIDCLSKIKNANVLVTEKASILNNIHLVRDKNILYYHPVPKELILKNLLLTQEFINL